MLLKNRYRAYQALAFALTFLSYALYHAGRQPYSTTKSALQPPGNSTESGSAGYAPFNSDGGGVYLGALDTTFLVAYAVGLFIAGPLGDRVNLRLFLGLGMIGSGVFLGLVGLYFYLNVHSVVLFAGADLVAGFFQATGWPGCVVVMTRWFDRAHMGTVMGVWNAHSSVGNILGKYIGAALQDALGWQWAFLGIGLLLAAGGAVQLLFLKPGPTDVFSEEELRLIAEGRESVEDYQDMDRIDDPAAVLSAPPDAIDHRSSSGRPLAPPSPPVLPPDPEQHQPLPFIRALLIPGVLEFSFALFFSKLVTYALIFWLPYYLSTLKYSDATASNMSTAFDYGGIVGGVLSGWWSDWNGKRGWVSFLMSLACIPTIWLYTWLGAYGWFANVAVLFVVGIMVNGPYTLISSAVCSDLGSHPSLKGNPRAMSTVTGIIDGFGSAGAAMEGLVVNGLYNTLGWDSVFYALMVFSLLCCLTIIRVVKHELFGVGGTASYGATTDDGAEFEEGEHSEEDDDDEHHEKLTMTMEVEPGGVVVYEPSPRKARRINTSR